MKAELTRIVEGLKQPLLSQTGDRHAAVACVLRVVPNEELEVLFILRSGKDGDRRWSGQVGLPGGHLEPGETAAEAAERECLEEVGLDLRKNSLFLGQVREPRPVPTQRGGVDSLLIVTTRVYLLLDCDQCRQNNSPLTDFVLNVHNDGNNNNNSSNSSSDSSKSNVSGSASCNGLSPVSSSGCNARNNTATTTNNNNTTANTTNTSTAATTSNTATTATTPTSNTTNTPNTTNTTNTNTTNTTNTTATTCVVDDAKSGSSDTKQQPAKCCNALQLQASEIAAAAWTPLSALTTDAYVESLHIGSPWDGLHSCVCLPLRDLELAPGIPETLARSRFQLWGLTLTLINTWLLQCKLRTDPISHSARL